MDDGRKDELTELFFRCNRCIRLARGGKQGQRRVLNILREHSPMTQRDLQEHLNIQAGSISEIITKMEQSGCIIKTRDERDKRKAILQITEKGLAVSDEENEQARLRSRTIYNNMEDEELEELFRLLTKLAAQCGGGAESKEKTGRGDKPI